VTTVIAAIADIISEEVLESNRISLADHTGTKMVSIYPKVNGSVSDADIERETTAVHTAIPNDDEPAQGGNTGGNNGGNQQGGGNNGGLEP
jgi:hypothetical protein